MGARAIGASITLICIVLAIVYLLLFYLGYGWQLIAIVVSIATFVVIGILGWIGWTMATTPSLKPAEVGSETQPSEARKASKTPKRA
ncbi:MAG: transcriptional regulator [Candidatus Hadarchaeaceae archaeon]